MKKLILSFLLVAFCSACQNPHPIPTEDSSVTITLAVEELERNYYQPIVEAFEEEYPDIRVQLISVSEVSIYGEADGVEALARSADLFPYYANFQDGVSNLLDLQPFIEADPSFNPEDFFPNLLNPPSQPQWSIPVGVRYPVIYYDKIAFDHAGLAYPPLDWSLNEFLSTAIALTERDGETVTHWGYIPNQVRYNPLLIAHLASPLTENGVIRLTDPDVVTAVEWMSNLFTEQAVSPWLDIYKPVDQQSGADLSQLALMESGMGAMWDRTHVVFDGSDRVGVTAIPQGEYGYAADPVQGGFAISKGTRYPDAAWQLLNFLSHQPPPTLVRQMPVPARQSVAAALDYWELLPPALAPAVQFAAEHNTSARLRRDDSTLLLEAIVAYIDRNVPVAETLVRMQTANEDPTETVATEVFEIAEAETEEIPGDTQITFIVSAAADITRLRPLAAQYHSEHPAVNVRLVNRELQDNGQYSNPLVGDCFVAEAAEIVGDVRSSILPLTPLLELDPLLRVENFYPVLMSRLMEEGTIYGLPAFAPIPYLQYNRALFSAANIPDPQLDWTLDDFLWIVQKLTTGEESSKQYGYADWLNVLVGEGDVQFGLQLIDHSNEIPDFDYQIASEMISWYVDLIRVYGVQPSIIDSPIRREQFEALLQSERVALWPEQASIVMMTAGNFPADMEVGVAPIPKGPNGGLDASEYLYAYYILADTSQREACWDWIKFLTLHPATTVYMPAHIKTAESAAFSEAVGVDLAAVYQATMNNSVSVREWMPAWMSPARIWLIGAYQEAVSGVSNVESALANAQLKFARYRQCIIENNAFNDVAQQQACRTQSE